MPIGYARASPMDSTAPTRRRFSAWLAGAGAPIHQTIARRRVLPGYLVSSDVNGAEALCVVDILQGILVVNHDVGPLSLLQRACIVEFQHAGGGAGRRHQ